MNQLIYVESGSTLSIIASDFNSACRFMKILSPGTLAYQCYQMVVYDTVTAANITHKCFGLSCNFQASINVDYLDLVSGSLTIAPVYVSSPPHHTHH